MVVCRVVIMSSVPPKRKQDVVVAGTVFEMPEKGSDGKMAGAAVCFVSDGEQRKKGE